MEDKTNKNTKTYLIVSSVLLTLSLFPAFVMAMFSPMLMDSPGSEENIITLSIMIGVISYPLITILFGILSWIFFKREKRWVSLILMSYPYIHIFFIILLFIALEVFCDGNFRC